jgi:uncharacterized protein
VDLRLDPTADGIALDVKVVPGSSRDRIAGPLGQALKLAVSKPPSGGQANAAVIALIAATLGVRPQQVRIVRGHSNPRKRVEVDGITADAARSLFSAGAGA